jgi:hypothetical protein
VSYSLKNEIHIPSLQDYFINAGHKRNTTNFGVLCYSLHVILSDWRYTACSRYSLKCFGVREEHTTAIDVSIEAFTAHEFPGQEQATTQDKKPHHIPAAVGSEEANPRKKALC